MIQSPAFEKSVERAGSVINLLRDFGRPEVVADHSPHLVHRSKTLKAIYGLLRFGNVTPSQLTALSKRIENDPTLLGTLANIETDVLGTEYYSDPRELIAILRQEIALNPRAQILLQLIAGTPNGLSEELRLRLTTDLIRNDPTIRHFLAAVEKRISETGNFSFRPILYRLFNEAGLGLKDNVLHH